MITDGPFTVLVGTVQNANVSFLIPVTAIGKFAQENERFIEKYCADHAAFLSDPKAYYKAQLHEKKPGAARGFGDDGWQASYVSPYENEHRFRKAEAVGGYVCAGFGEDGIAVRAAQGYTHTTHESTGAEGFQFQTGQNRTSAKPSLPQATMPSPVNVAGRWEYPDESLFFSHIDEYRWTPPVPIKEANLPVRPYGVHLVSKPAQTRPSQAKRKAARKGTQNLFDHFYKLRPEDFEGYVPTDAEIERWRREYWGKRRQFDCRQGRLEPWCECAACQAWYSNKERVDWRTRWLEGDDISTRKVRDLNARLKLYRYGDHHLQTSTMLEVTARRLHKARAAFPRAINVFWP
jgi:hypothetical protein